MFIALPKNNATFETSVSRSGSAFYTELSNLKFATLNIQFSEIWVGITRFSEFSSFFLDRSPCKNLFDLVKSRFSEQKNFPQNSLNRILVVAVYF